MEVLHEEFAIEYDISLSLEFSLKGSNLDSEIIVVSVGVEIKNNILPLRVEHELLNVSDILLPVILSRLIRSNNFLLDHILKKAIDEAL